MEVVWKACWKMIFSSRARAPVPRSIPKVITDAANPSRHPPGPDQDQRREASCRGDWPVARNVVKDRFTNSYVVTSEPKPNATDAKRTGDRPAAPTKEDKTPIFPTR